MIQLNDNYYIGAQITHKDFPKLKDLGITTVINNRPDGEEYSQPKAIELSEIAKKHGIDYHHIPVSGFPSDEQVNKLKNILEKTKTPIYAFCRSGARAQIIYDSANK